MTLRQQVKAHTADMLTAAEIVRHIIIKIRSPSKLIGRSGIIFVLHVCRMLAIASYRSVNKILKFDALRIAWQSSDA